MKCLLINIQVCLKATAVAAGSWLGLICNFSQRTQTCLIVFHYGRGRENRERNGTGKFSVLKMGKSYLAKALCVPVY